MDHDVDLGRLLHAVEDRTTFLAFVRALAADRRAEIELERASPSSLYGPGAMGWENTSIDRFLDAGVSWAEDVLGTNDERVRQFPESPSWKTFADFLYAARGYE